MQNVNIDRDNIRHLLDVGVVEVDFTKKNGENRVLKCTLQEYYLPEMKGEVTDRNKSEDTLCVWDVDNNGWRSFRWDSVNCVTVIG